MWRYNFLIKRGYVPIVADKHELYAHNSWTNVLMAKGMKRKTIRLSGIWALEVLRDNVKGKINER